MPKVRLGGMITDRVTQGTRTRSRHFESSNGPGINGPRGGKDTFLLCRRHVRPIGGDTD